jgi:hypothetical protein
MGAVAPLSPRLANWVPITFIVVMVVAIMWEATGGCAVDIPTDHAAAATDIDLGIDLDELRKAVADFKRSVSALNKDGVHCWVVTGSEERV